MNIAVYIPSLAKKSSSNFIVETFFPLLGLLKQHHAVIITDDNNISTLFSNLQTIIIKSQPQNSLLRKFWIERTVAKTLKDIKADLFIWADNFCSLRTTIRQCILVNPAVALKSSYASKANCLIVPDRKTEQELIKRIDLVKDKVSILHSFPGSENVPIDFVQRDAIKDKYAEGKEYFIYPGSFKTEEDFRTLLKAYSHFKKRQQSSFKLMILSPQPFSFQKAIENYKYRNDVVIICSGVANEKAKILAAAYSVILVLDNGDNIQAALNAMSSEVPLIATINSPVNEVAGEAALYAENDSKDMGEKMMQLYKDERLRYSMVQMGNELVKNFSINASAQQLQLCIAKAMN